MRCILPSFACNQTNFPVKICKHSTQQCHAFYWLTWHKRKRKMFLRCLALPWSCLIIAKVCTRMQWISLTHKKKRTVITLNICTCSDSLVHSGCFVAHSHSIAPTPIRLVIWSVKTCSLYSIQERRPTKMHRAIQSGIGLISILWNSSICWLSHFVRREVETFNER